MNSLGQKLEELRRSAGLTQDELAEKLEVSRQAISQWEMDIVAPKADKLKAICIFFKVSSDYLLFDEHVVEQSVTLTEEVEEKPKKLSRTKKIIITTSIIISILAAAFMLFIAWLEAPPKDAVEWVSISSWNFDIVAIMQLSAGLIIFVLLCVAVWYIVKLIKNRIKIKKQK